MPFTKENAVEIGRLGGLKVNKNKAWLKLRKHVTGKHTTHIDEYLDGLWEEDRRDEYFEAYMKLLQYFQPKVVAHAVRTQTEVIFRFEPEDQALFEDV